MGLQRPPSPRAEDEESALKNEVAYDSDVNSKTEAEEARCRGTVDQYPIIVDIDHEARSKCDYKSSTDNKGESFRSQSSDESYGPPTPPNSKASQQHPQFLPIPPNSRSWSGEMTQPQNIAREPEEDVAVRGRSYTSSLQTDMDGDLQGMISGRRRAPSPYSYTKPDAPTKSDTSKRFSGSTFLAPEHIAPTQSFTMVKNTRRASSARPRSKSRLRNDSDNSTDHETRRRHHSQRRSTRETFSSAQSLADDGPKEYSAGEKGSSYYAHRRSTKDGHSKETPDTEISHRSKASDRQSRRLSRGPPPTSSAEDSWSRSCLDYVPNSNCLSNESPYTSSAEEPRTYRRHRLRPEDAEVRKSHRGSGSRNERPRLDLSGHPYSHNGAPTEERHGSSRHGRRANSILDGRTSLEPSSPRSRSAMEEYLDRSPLHSSPRTPCVDRIPKDYFSLGVPAPENVRPRTASHGERQCSQVNPMTSVLTAAGGASAVPSLSRSSTSSAEIHSSDNLKKPTSGYRSRKNSSIREKRPSFSRPGDEHEKSVPRVIRHEQGPDSRPGSRSGSTSYIAPAVASSDRSTTGSDSHLPTPSAIPRLNHGAVPYSAADEPQHARQPSSARSAPLHLALPLTSNQVPPSATPRLPRSPSSSEKAPRQHQLSELPPCPRSVPEAGHYDWFSIVGMPQLNVCPSCMTVVGASRFRDMFVSSTSKVPGQQILCDFSRPWVRNAWTQIIKQRRSSLDMIHQIIRNSDTTKPCPGKCSDVRAWYRLPDPQTGTNVPNFDACSECVRSIEIIFPQLRGIFKRSGALVQERTCDLNSQSKRFDNYLELLDAAALQYDVERLREPDIRTFANYARKTARVRECTRDDMVMGQLWHFIPGLHEFTICEECFDQVVWPVADQAIASSVNRTLQLVPGNQPNTGISCQLYSKRMRTTFLEAVKYADFEFLKQAALRRHGVERLLQEKHKLLMNDMAMGKDRTADLQANIAEWRKWE